MGKTVLESGSPSRFFLDQLHQAGVSDRAIDGSVADDAVGGPKVGVCRVGEAKDGKVERSEVFAVAFNNLVKHGETIKRYFQKLGLKEVEHLQQDGTFDGAYHDSVRQELLGKDPQRSLRAWPNPKKLNPTDAGYAGALVQWAARNTRLPLLPYKEQVAALKELGLEEAQVKGELGKLWQGQTLPKMMAHASVLRGEELLQEAKAKRAVGDAKEATALEKSAHRLFRTAVEMDGDNPSARRRLAESFEAQGRFKEAGLHYAQALRSEPDFDGILQILDRLSGPSGAEMLGKSPDAFSFVGFALKDAGRHPEAALIFHRAAQAATAAGQHKKSLAFTEQELLAQEATQPYVALFTAESNPVAKTLYGALRDAGIPSASIDGASGREGEAPDRKISAAEVFGYLEAHQGEARIKKALKKLRFEMPWQDAKGRLKPEFDTPAFAKLSLAGRMAHWHAQEATRLKEKGAKTDLPAIAKHLRMASYYEPENAARQTALGEFYLAHQDGAKAKAAYLAAVAVDPGNVALQLPLGRALAASGDFKSARAAYDVYLKAHPDDAATQKLRAEAERGYQGTLRQDFDAEMLRFHSLAQVNPAEALKSLKTLEEMAKELESSRSEEPLDRVQNLKRAAAFYEAVVHLEAAHDSYDRDTIWAAQGRLRKASSEAEQSVRDSLKVPEGGSPTRAQVERARAFVAIQLDVKGEPTSLGVFEDLKTLATLLRDVPSSEMNEAERLAAFDGLLQSYGKCRKMFAMYHSDRDGSLAHEIHDVAGQVLDASFGTKDSADRKLAQELVHRVVDDGDLRLLPFFSAKGLQDYVAKSHAADQALAAAQKVSDVREKRGALLQVLGELAKLRDDKRVETVLTEIRGTVDDKMSDTDKLQIETAAYLALRGSGLSQEKNLLDASKLRALKMAFVRDTSSPSADVKQLLLLKSYYDTVGDAAGAKKIETDLHATRDALLNRLKFGSPSEGLKAPTDAKERLELAALSVQIDQALLASDTTSTLSQVPIEARTSLYTSRLQIWRQELAKAKELPYAERLEQARMLAQSVAVYHGLTEGEGAFLDKGKVDAELKAIQQEIDPILAEYFAQEPGAPAAQQKLAEKITQDLQDRFHAAMAKGDLAWLETGLSSESMLHFGERSQSAHLLLAEAMTQRGPRSVELRLKATALFIELGLEGRVKETLAPVEEFAAKLGDPRRKVGLLLAVTQGYQQAGLKKEANQALQKVIDLDGPNASPEVRELATLARGMQALNDGDLAKAQETLAAIPKNPTAQAILAKLSEGTEQRRLRMTFDALAPVLFSVYQGKRTELSDQETTEIRDKVQATLQKWQQQLASGELRSLDDAFRRDMGGFYFESFEGAVMKSFASRIANPDMTDAEFSRALLGLSRGMLRAEMYGASMGIAQLLTKDPFVGAEAKGVLDDIPGQARWDGILTSLKNMTIIFADSDAEALKSAAIMLVSFGVGRLLAVGAEAAWVARASTFIRSPIVMRASTFAVKTTAEAAGFTLGSMSMETLWTGKTSHWNLKHFSTEFGSMLVTFVLLHGVGMGMQGLSAASARYVGRAEAGMARALEGGGSVGAAAFELRLAKGMNAVAKSGVTAWGTRVLAFTGTEYVNEAIGLRPKENVPFWVRLAGSALMDAQMMIAGKTVNAISGGKIAKLEQASQLKLAKHRMEYQAKELLPLVERMGFDAKTAEGRAVWEALLQSRTQGESLKSIEARTGAEEMARYDKIVAEQFGLDPKSSQGRSAKAALLGYAQIHPFAEPGKPLGATELAGIAGKLRGEASKLLTEAGIERGKNFDALRDGLLGFALQTGLEPAQLGEYAAQAKGLKAPLQELANQILGPDGARTPEGQTLMGELAVYAMFRASAPEKMGEPLQSLLSAGANTEVQAELRTRAESLFGKNGAETPVGRAWMAKLFLRALHESAEPSGLLSGLKSLEAGGTHLSALADVSGLTQPKQRLALADWALENGVSAESVRGLVNLVLQGKIEIRLEDGRPHFQKVPEGEQSAKAQAVLDRLPELPSELLREDRAATRRAEDEIMTVTDDMIVSAEPLHRPTDGEATVPGKKLAVPTDEVTKPGKKIPVEDSSGEVTVPGKKLTARPLAARKGATAKAAGEMPLVDLGEGPMPLSPKDKASIPPVEIRSGEERLTLNLEAGKVLSLGVQGGKLVVGEKAKEALAEIEVMRDADGALGFYLRRSGQAKRQRLKSGDLIKLGETSFVWEGEGKAARPDLKLVPKQAAPSYDAMVERGQPETSAVLKLVESADGAPSADGVQWTSSFANLTVPNQAQVPIIGSWRHISRAEFEAARDRGALANTPSSTYEVQVRGKQRLADIEARLKKAYGDRLERLEGREGFGSEWLLRNESGEAQIRIVLDFKDQPPPTPAEAKAAFAAFEGKHLKTLTTWAKEQGTVRSLYAFRMLHLIGAESDGKGGTRFGSRFGEALARYEKAAEPADKARAGEELATMLAFVRDATTLVPEFQRLQDAHAVTATSRAGKAVAWAKEQPGPLGEQGKAAEAVFLSLGEKAEKVRMLGEELRREIPFERQKEGNPVYEEYRQAMSELESAIQTIRGLEAKAAESGVNLDTFKPAKSPLVPPPLPPRKSEVTKKAGPAVSPAVPVGAGIQGKIGLSVVEIDAHSFLDFYFGEKGSISNVRALAKRSEGATRDAYGDNAADFLRALETFRAKVERYDSLERDFETHRKAFHAAEGKDPAKAAEAKRLAEAAVKERAALQIEIERDLGKLKAEPYNQLELRYNERIERSEKELLNLDFALAAAEVEATVAARGTGERPDLQYEFVYKPMLEISERHFDSEFGKLPLGDLVRAEVRVTRWEAAERAVDQMIEEGALRPEQKPDFAALRASGAKEVSMTAEVPGAGEMQVVFRFEGKVEKAAAKTPALGKTGSTSAAMFLGLTTLLTPELAHAADKATSDGSILPWMLGAGATVVAVGIGAFMLWAKGRSGGKVEPQIRQRRSVNSGAERIPDIPPLVDFVPPQVKPRQPPAVQPVTPAPVQQIPASLPVAKPEPIVLPVKGTVQAVLQDNVLGKARQGAYGKPLASSEYGTFSVKTGEGIGYKKDHNEDGFVQGRNWGLVLDGMGGMGSGDKASELAGKKFAEEMALHGDMARAMAAAGDAVNASPYASGGAVAVAHQILPLPGGGHVARIVHVGDAGAIVFRKNAQGEFDLVYRTEEQSMAAEARRGGMLRDTLAMRASDFANVVSGGLGTGRKANPVVKDVPIQEGDVILSFSDGVGDNVSRAELNQILKASRSAEEVQSKVWDLVHWKMQRLALVKGIFRGETTSGGVIRDFVDAEGNARKGVELDESPGYFIDRKGHVYDSNGALVDHYKADNVTIHAYVHDVAKAKSGPDSEKTLVMPALSPTRLDAAGAVTQVIQIPQPRWTNSGEILLPKNFGSAFVGRDGSQGAKIQLGLPEISSRHAEFLESEGELWIRDRGSLNGTWINGRRVQGDEAHVVGQGDLVTFGTRSYQVDLLPNGEARLTPALIVSPQQNGFSFGPVTVYQAETGAYAIRNDGSPHVKVGGGALAADGNAYRIRDGEAIQIDGMNYVFREFK